MSIPYFIQARVGAFRRNLSWSMRRFYRDDDPDPAKSIFICGAGRSGTTWLVEVFNSTNEYRMLYEPFNCEQVRRCRHFSARQYLRPLNDDPAYLEPARAIFSGAIRDPWIDQYNRCKNARSRLIKDVRCTLMLKWIRNHFPETPMIFIIRHPCAVALSRLDYGWRTDLRENVFFPQKSLMADYLAPLTEQLAWANSPFERHVVDWCIENFVPLAQLDKGDVHLVFYENLLVSPTEELRKLFDFLKRPFDESILERRHRRSASSRLRRGNLGVVRSRDNPVDGWRRHVSPSELEAAGRITKIFGLDRIYGDSSGPNPSEVQAMITNVGARP